jgi:hypothetical protein
LIELLEALEASPPASLLRTSFYLYPIVNALHIVAIGALITTATLMDLRVLGLGRAIPAAVVLRYLRPLAIGALILALLTGLALFSVRPLDYIAMPVFQVKLALVAIATLNALAFEFLDRRRDGQGTGLKAMVITSLILWPTVLLCGRFIGFVAE